VRETVAEISDGHGQPELAKPKQKKPGWLEKRRQRRRRRIVFEEIMGWVLVPFLIYFLYLGYKAMGGLPPTVKEFLNELLGFVMKGGK
jgi:hypothetical protein